jgi:hypothetical protein
MKKSMCVVLIFTVLFAGCAGREANPIPAYLPGDENRSCSALKAEMTQIQADMQRLLPHTNKFATNTLWAIGGVLVIVPFFFMDLKDAEKIEYEALRTRYNRLLIIAADKNCDLVGLSTQPIPTIKEQKEIAEKVKKETKKIPKKNKEGKKLINYKVDVLPNNEVKVTPIYEGDSNEVLQVQHDRITGPWGPMPVVSYTYDATSQKGVLSVDISGKGIEAREWVVKNIGNICSSKNITLEAGKETKTGGRYRVLNESVRDGILTIEFETAW